MTKKELVMKAEELGIENNGSRTKNDLILAIQEAEGVNQCYGSLASDCPFTDCCFIQDCYKEGRKKASVCI